MSQWSARQLAALGAVAATILLVVAFLLPGAPPKFDADTLKIGICGEHGGEPRSVGFCHRLELDYVSCSPFRVPVARLAAAQAVLAETGTAQYVTAGG